MRLEHRTVEALGHTITYQTAGAGEPVVLVHGLAGSTRWWRYNVPALAEQYAVYLVNLPGFGSFRRRGPRFALAEAAGWLAAWTDAAGVGPCHLVGHSMGGFLAVRLAAGWPGLVRRLVLVAPALIGSGGPLLRYLPPLVLAGLRARPTFLPVLALDTLRAGPRTILRAARDLLSEDARADLDAVRAPTLLVWGLRDPLVPPSLGELLRAALPAAEFLALPRAGHVPQFDQPEAFNAAVLAFLNGVQEPDALASPVAQDGPGRVRNGHTTSASQPGWL